MYLSNHLKYKREIGDLLLLCGYVVLKCSIKPVMIEKKLENPKMTARSFLLDWIGLPEANVFMI